MAEIRYTKLVVLDCKKNCHPYHDGAFCKYGKIGDCEHYEPIEGSTMCRFVGSSFELIENRKFEHFTVIYDEALSFITLRLNESESGVELVRPHYEYCKELYIDGEKVFPKEKK